MIRLELEDREVDYIATVLGAVPTMQTVQANMLHLIPKIGQQAQECVQAQQQMQLEVGEAMAEAAK